MLPSIQEGSLSTNRSSENARAGQPRWAASCASWGCHDRRHGRATRKKTRPLKWPLKRAPRLLRKLQHTHKKRIRLFFQSLPGLDPGTRRALDKKGRTCHVWWRRGERPPACATSASRSPISSPRSSLAAIAEAACNAWNRLHRGRTHHVPVLVPLDTEGQTLGSRVLQPALHLSWEHMAHGESPRHACCVGKQACRLTPTAPWPVASRIMAALWEGSRGCLKQKRKWPVPTITAIPFHPEWNCTIKPRRPTKW